MWKTSHNQQKKELEAIIDDFALPILLEQLEAKYQEKSQLEAKYQEKIQLEAKNQGKKDYIYQRIVYQKVVISKIRMLVEKSKGVLENRKKWDGDLMAHFERIQKKIYDDSKNKGDDDEEKDTDDEWLWIMEKLEDLLRNQKVNVPTVGRVLLRNQEVNVPTVGRLSDYEASPQKSAISKIGEPSNNNNHDNDSLIQFNEYINQLNPEQKNCLYSLCIFPENAKLKKRLLLHWWVGLGLSLGQNKNITIEQVAKNFFCDLVKKKILQPIHIRRHNQVVDCCIINPTIHRKLISTCNQNLLKNVNNNESTLWFYCDDKSKVRALLNLDDQYLNFQDITKNVLINDPTMQAVQFGNWHCTELEVSNMVEGDVSMRTNFNDHIEVHKTDFLVKLVKNVAFLSLRNIIGIEKLPDSIGKLDNLRILDLRACHNLEALPGKQWSKVHTIFGLVSRQQKWFKNLTYLDISECFLLHHMPKWVCELSNLEVLKGFLASNAGKEKKLCRLGDLSKLKKLRKLSVRIAMHLDPEELSGLKPLENLSVLTLNWVSDNQYEHSIRGSGGKEIKGQNNAGGKVSTISFPKNLEKLDIRRYSKDEAPELLNPEELQKLKRLYIRGGKLAKIENKPGWKVEILRLRYLKYLDLHWDDMRSIFVELKCVEYEHCFKLKYFPRQLSYWSVETNGPFSSASNESIFPEVLIDHGRVNMTITRKMKAPLAYHESKVLLELTGWDSISERPGLDLVVVLDVSRNMNKEFIIREVRNAMLFVIKKLSSIDRLSIVTFSDKATMVYPLSPVFDSSRMEAKNLVINLKATNDEWADLSVGLRMGVDIINDHSNSGGRVASIMLLGTAAGTIRTDYIIPPIDNVTVHTLFLGELYDNYHCTKVLTGIASSSRGGTFSNVCVAKNLTKAVSVCLAGLLTVAVQDLTLTISPIEEEAAATVKKVSAGRYHRFMDKADGPVIIKFGDLYNNEVRKILVDLHFPATDKECESKVVKISCSYRVKEILFEPEPVVVTVRRMIKLPSYYLQPPPMVMVEEYRKKFIEVIIFPLQMGDPVQECITNAQNVLRELVKREADCNALSEIMSPELQHLLGQCQRPRAGYSFACSLYNSHYNQRAVVRGIKPEEFKEFYTPTMKEFLKQAEEFGALRQKQEDTVAHIL